MGAWYRGRVARGREVVAFGALGAACALLPALAMWGFTVDDALIPVRYAHELAVGAGYRFGAGAPVSDGVTPLPWAFVLAPFARGGDALATLGVAKAIGALAWVAAGAALGVRLAELGRETWRGACALAVVALAFPIGAWAASGMETGLATALVTLAATRAGRDAPRGVAIFGGLAASLRPELVVWAVVASALDAASTASKRASGDARARAVGGAVFANGALAVAPFVACVVARLVVFGHPAPLAVLAKPSDLAHGIPYAGAAAVVVLTPLLACAPVAIARARGVAVTLSVAFLAHVAAVALAGGDWMPYARLMVPVAPSLAIVFVASESASRGGRASALARGALALALGVFLAARTAPAGRHVLADRTELVSRARPVLAEARVVAALDVGWVSAATDARVVDLAGLTDATIAALPGGHTSKHVDAGMLLDRGVDTVVVYGEPRVVEARLLGSPLFRARYARGEHLPLGTGGAGYDVYRRRAP